MKKAYLWWAGIIIIVLLGWYMFGKAPASQPASNEPIKIGVVAPMSGDAGAYGPQVQYAAGYQLKKINDVAGANGQKFELVYEDGKCAGAEATNVFQKLTDVDRVKVIIGGLCSSETLAMSPLANEKKVVLISYGSSNPKIENEGPYTFSLSYSDSIVGEELAKAVSKYKKVAIISEQNDYNVGIHDVFVSALKNYPDVKLVADETFPKGSADFRGVLTKIKATAPEAMVLNPNAGITAENLLKQVAELKAWTGDKLYAQYGYLNDAARAGAGKFADGMTIIDAPAITNAKFLAALSEIEKEHGPLKDLGNYYTASTMDAVSLATSLISNYGNDPVKIQNALSTGSFDGYIGKIRFDGNNFVRFNLSGTYIIKDGKAVLQ